IPAARPSAPHFMPSETAPIAPARVTSVNSKGGKLPITLSIIIGGLIVVIVAARIAVKTLAPSPQSNSTPAAALSPTPQLTESAAYSPATPEPSAPEAMRTLTYSVTRWKDPKRYPDSAPFQIPGEVIFSPGDRVHFSFISPQRVYLYIINESPPAKGQASSFNTLFPTPTANQGSAQLAAG